MSEEDIFLYLNGELDIEKRQITEEWIKNNANEFELIKKIWEASEHDKSDLNINTSKAWEEIKKKNDYGAKNRYLKWASAIMRYAAFFTILIAAAGILSFTVFDIHKENWLQYTTSHKTETFSLPDGSRVTLNKHAQLYYNKQLISKTRELKLYGEAFFEVKRNENKPFKVIAHNTVTEVLGTSFNIDASDTTSAIITYVNTGKVAFYTANDAETKLILMPGEVGSYNIEDNSLQENNSKSANYLSWKTGILTFKSQTLKAICYDLEKHFDTSIQITNQELENLLITARYNNKSLTEILNILSLSLNIEYHITPDGVKISRHI